MAGEFTLSNIDPTNPGEFTLREVDGAVASVTVPVKVGSEFLTGIPGNSRVFVKIDVEGFEHHVIRGLEPLLERPDVALSIEFTDEWLHETGSSAAELFAALTDRGFKAFLPHLHRSPLGRRTLRLIGVATAPPLAKYDAIFLRGSFLDMTMPADLDS